VAQLLVIDYGFPQSASITTRSAAQGTLIGHTGIMQHANPFLLAGAFRPDRACRLHRHRVSRRAGAGLQVAGYAPQAAFLLGCGVLDRLRENGRSGVRRLPARNCRSAQADVAGRNGRAFSRCWRSRKSDDIRWPGFRVTDRSHRLVICTKKGDPRLQKSRYVIGKQRVSWPACLAGPRLDASAGNS